MNESNAIFDSIQLIPLGESEISPLMTKVKIKVFHLGMNRNRSYIDKDTALQMAKTLRGCPIAGRYREEKGDFTDHGEEITINDQGVKVEWLTKPYGFVDLNAKVWFEDYIDIDEFGNQLQHTYLVTEGVVWTEQYPELKETLGFDGARPQSMELDEKTMKGNWSQDYNSGVEFFIISEAVITKLCILGEDVEPCFLGSTVALENKEEEMFNFSLNKDFGQKLYNMMQELNLALKGEPKMDNEQSIVSEQVEVSTNFENSQDNVVEENISENENTVESNFEAVEESLEAPSVEEEAPATEVVEEAAQEVIVEEAPVVEESVSAEAPEVEVEFAKEEDKKEESKEEDSKEDAEESDSKEEKEDESKDEEKKKYSLLEEEYNTLKTQYAELETKYQELAAYKANKEDAEKDSLINSFSMLDADEKKEVIENKSKFSLEEIESKLSVIFTRKQMKAQEEAVEEKAVEVDIPTVYSVHEDLSNVPDWVKAVKETEKNM